MNNFFFLKNVTFDEEYIVSHNDFRYLDNLFFHRLANQQRVPNVNSVKSILVQNWTDIKKLVHSDQENQVETGHSSTWGYEMKPQQSTRLPRTTRLSWTSIECASRNTTAYPSSSHLYSPRKVSYELMVYLLHIWISSQH